MARPKSKPSPDESEPIVKAESDSLILTQEQHFALSDKEKAQFRAKGGTVSNQ